MCEHIENNKVYWTTEDRDCTSDEIVAICDLCGADISQDLDDLLYCAEQKLINQKLGLRAPKV